MNRLIIVGNGFDKAHGLDSDYNSFIKDYLFNTLHSFLKGGEYSYDDGLISIEKVGDSSRVPDDFDKKDKIFETINEFRLGKYPSFEFKFLSDFMTEICSDAEYKWVDIERTYYKHLIIEFNRIKDQQSISKEDYEPIRVLNSQMKVLGEALENYLKKEADEKYKNASLDYEAIFYPFNQREFEPGIWEKIETEEGMPKQPEKVTILNFNYTNPFVLATAINNIDVINIHGYLKSSNNPIVLGYGDERDEAYTELEKAGEDELLRHIKSFSYFQNSSYSRLLGFIESGDFEVWIAGHSCGTSDKTLLAQIFEHEDCKNIRVYHFKKSATEDNYNEIVYNIARVMKDKIKMRSIVTSKYGQNEFSNVAGIIKKN